MSTTFGVRESFVGSSFGVAKRVLVAGLAWVSALAGAGEQANDSARIFLEAAKVMQHPRCANCHAAGEFPKQGEERSRHAMGVKRGPKDRGTPGLSCNTCHQDRNMVGIPGAADWHMAPTTMGWGEMSAGEICRTITDTSKNGNRRPKGIVLHAENDSLVVWAWNPGEPRSKPPGSHADFVKLLARWAESGAACPD